MRPNLSDAPSGQYRASPDPTCCETCGADYVELFGYCRPGGWRWFCAAHRIGQFYADARRPSPQPSEWWQPPEGINE